MPIIIPSVLNTDTVKLPRYSFFRQCFKSILSGGFFMDLDILFHREGQMYERCFCPRLVLERD